MATQRRRSRSSPRPPSSLHKPRGLINDRAAKVGPAHFGIACFDSHKGQTQWLLADYFGNVLLPSASLEHNQPALDDAIAQLQAARQQHDLQDLIVVVERTGRFHRTVQRAFAQAGFEVRVIHPYVTKQFRQAANPGDKTDDHDLAAMQRATTSGFALLENERDDTWTTFLLLIRYRRRLVRHCGRLRCQIRQHLDAVLPGFMDAFKDFWDNNCAWPVARHFASAQAIQKAGLAGLCAVLKEQGIQFHRRSLTPILEWARQAPAADVAPATYHRIALALHDDYLQKLQEIQGLEQESAGLLCRTGYVRLLSCPGLNIVSAADLAAELGPIEHYPTPQAITGRAGLRPSRYQSGKVDRKGGPLLRCGNRALRRALLQGADCLLGSNDHFKELAESWAARGDDPRHRRIKIGQRLARILFHLVAGNKVFCHPNYEGRHYILNKLMEFHREQGTPAATLITDLEAAVSQLPVAEYAAEAKPVQEYLESLQNGSHRDRLGLAPLLPNVLALLGVKRVQSTKSGARNPH
jgi:transposase